jgi:hypothetical protein
MQQRLEIGPPFASIHPTAADLQEFIVERGSVLPVSTLTPV